MCYDPSYLHFPHKLNEIKTERVSKNADALDVSQGFLTVDEMLVVSVWRWVLGGVAMKRLAAGNR